jgi:hypothetical protein
MTLASNQLINEYKEYFLVGKGGRCLGLTIESPSYVDCLEIWEPQPPDNLRDSPVMYRDSFTFLNLSKLRTNEDYRVQLSKWSYI